jgi:AcrR family transcriptional regulator
MCGLYLSKHSAILSSLQSDRSEVHVPDIEPAKRGRGRPSTGAREAIVAAALELIGDHGLARLTTREIARRAGVSEASVFYHYGDKIGLLQAAVLAGLGPLKSLDPGTPAGHSDRPLAETLLQTAAALESFFDRALPLLETVQSDPALRAEFADGLVKRDRGPHRGVRFVHEQLTALTERGLVRSDANTEAAALLLVGACFLRAWSRRLAGARRERTLPSLDETVRALAQLLAPAADPRPVDG